ncbi:hypothetical protein PILCRDRAFT_811523 [Piloderma croceum F 1598]|uniref:C2 domain-containing protein n=1 Tax=Piloderma croceum (strain F 1598) TaxID=765440 RepID=A0A0C3G3X8_PILCF|nr:hypothetical protein PILCRDRAFT_811523 [Piloderma croceum F 1598]
MSSTPVEIGTLIAVILKAKNLPNKRHIGKQDPYCCISFHNEKRRTRAIKRGGQHPEWDEEVRFSLFEDTDDGHSRKEDGGDTPPPPPPKNPNIPRKVRGGTSMKIQCFADDPREPDLIGETMVDLTEVLTKGETDEWFTLMNKDKYCGEVYLELTFWSNERPPEKKVTPKASKNSKQYAGPGTFVPTGELPSSLHSGRGLRHSGSGNAYENDHQDSLPSSLSSARLDLYSAPYEQRSMFSPVEGVTNDFGELNVSDLRRRDSFPPVQNQTPRPSSSTGFSSLPVHSLQGFEPRTYSDGSSQFSYDSPTQLYHRATISGGPHPFAGQPPYQPQYESGSPTVNYVPQQPSTRQNGLRYSLPTASSGFMPILSPAAPSFVPLPPSQPDPSSFAPPAQTPTMGYGTLQMPTQPGFAPIPAQTPAPSGFMSPVQSSPSPSFHQSQTYSSHPQLSFQYSQYAPQPPPSVSPQQYPPSTQSAPPQQYLPPQPPPSAPPQSHSAPPQPYTGYIDSNPSPPHEFVPPPPPPPPPPPLSNALSSSQGVGSRPLPQQPTNYTQQSIQRHSSLSLPPGSQSHSPTQIGPVTFPTANGYNSIPPPPPAPPQVGHERTRAQSYRPSSNSAPPPPPPLPPSQFHSSSPSGRPSLPQPPVGYQQQQQPLYQPIPPPPPPPDFVQQLPQPPPPPLQSNPAQLYYPPPQPHWTATPGQPGGNFPPLQTQSGRA